MDISKSIFRMRMLGLRLNTFSKQLARGRPGIGNRLPGGIVLSELSDVLLRGLEAGSSVLLLPSSEC